MHTSVWRTKAVGLPMVGALDPKFRGGLKCAELQVYFFHSMKGEGKVESFATVGAEH